jgi:hypothetical protein
VHKMLVGEEVVTRRQRECLLVEDEDAFAGNCFEGRPACLVCAAHCEVGSQAVLCPAQRHVWLRPAADWCELDLPRHRCRFVAQAHLPH